MLPTIQPSLFARAGPPRIDPRFSWVSRIVLSRGAWIDYSVGWLDGHEELLEALVTGTRWCHQRRRMYERIVNVPRLLARLPEDGPGHPVIGEMVAALSARYRLCLDQVSLALYRDGRDSVAWHGDRMGPLRNGTVIAIVSLGAPRRFLLRPAGGGRSLAFDLGRGDLLAMGGTCQRTWEHTVPKVARAEPRMSIQFREAVPTQEAGPARTPPEGPERREERRAP